jgi:hypothetical protein
LAEHRLAVEAPSSTGRQECAEVSLGQGLHTPVLLAALQVKALLELEVEFEEA